MSQFDFGTIDPNSKSGPQLALDLNKFRDALNSSHRGSARPAYAQAGMLWVRETSSTQWDLMLFDGDADFVLRSINPETNTLILIPQESVQGLTALAQGVADIGQASEAKIGLAKVATQQQADDGTDDLSFITSKKLAARIANFTRTASETVAGFAKIATQALVNAGADDSTYVTPKKLKAGFVFSFGTLGYIGLPSWLGGFMVQWGRVSGAAGSVVQAFPTSFSSNCYGVVGGPILNSLSRVESLNVSALAAMNFTCSRTYVAGGTAASSSTDHFFFAWGV